MSTLSGKSALVAVSLFGMASAASATVQCTTPPAPIAVPQTSAGMYVNLVTGVNNTAPASVPGWDFNPFGSASLSFFAAAPNASHGTVVTGSPARVPALAAGTPISAANTYGFNNQAAADVLAGNSAALIGVRFVNDNTAAVNFGWVEMNVSGPAGFPRSIVRWCYQDDGTQIQAGGTVPVTLQSFDVE